MTGLEKRLIVYGRVQRDGPELDELLQARGFRVYTLSSSEELQDVLRFSHPDAVLFTTPLQVPVILQLVRLCHDSPQSAVVVLWPGISVTDAVTLLDSGIDYVANSYQPDWLAAQLRACFRRIGRERSPESVIELGYLRIDLQQRTVTVHEREVPLTRTEFDVLRVLAERPGTVLPSGEIMQQVMGTRIGDAEAQDLLKVHVHRLRQKLEQAPNEPRFIRTVRGHGYMYAFERRSRDRETEQAAAPGE